MRRKIALEKTEDGHERNKSFGSLDLQRAVNGGVLTRERSAAMRGEDGRLEYDSALLSMRNFLFDSPSVVRL